MARSTATAENSMSTSLAAHGHTRGRPQSGHFICPQERTDYVLPTLSVAWLDHDRRPGLGWRWRRSHLDVSVACPLRALCRRDSHKAGQVSDPYAGPRAARDQPRTPGRDAHRSHPGGHSNHSAPRGLAAVTSPKEVTMDEVFPVLAGIA